MSNKWNGVACAALLGCACQAHGAARVQPGYVWRAETVSCGIGAGPVKEFAGAALAAVLLERGFDMLASTVRRAVTAAGQDKSVHFDAVKATYLADLPFGSTQPRSRNCVAIARGQPLAAGTDGAAPAFLEQATSAQKTEVKSDLKQLGLAQVDFYARMAFERSEDEVATRAALIYLYYPVRLYPGRGSAERALNIAATIVVPGGKEALFAGTLTLDEPATSPALRADAGALAKNAIGWFPSPSVTLSEEQKKTSGRKVPVNLTATVTETASGSRFFKQLDEYLNEETWNAIVTTGKTAWLPQDRKQAKDKAARAYEASIVAYFGAMSGLAKACEALGEDATAATQADALKNYYAALAAHRAMEDAKAPGVEIPAGTTFPVPAFCDG